MKKKEEKNIFVMLGEFLKTFRCPYFEKDNDLLSRIEMTYMDSDLSISIDVEGDEIVEAEVRQTFKKIRDRNFVKMNVKKRDGRKPKYKDKRRFNRTW